MRIAIVVPGRFHAFDLALALRARGHDAVVFTNYPAWAARRFGLPREAFRTFPTHGLLFRLAWAAHQRWGLPFPEARLNRLFGRWAVRALRREHWDVLHPWSALSEEILEAFRGSGVRILLMRGSSHIRTQARLLKEEELRTGAKMDQPSAWVIAREEREYALAETILVLSSFAEKSFQEEGVPASKIWRLLPAAPVERFRAAHDIVEARCARIVSGKPLEILYVGALSYRKGLFDLQKIIETLGVHQFHFRLVGPVTREAQVFARRFGDAVDIIGPRPERELPQWYARGDIFIFPTVEDGFALVLAQAVASLMPVLTTTHSAGPDLATASSLVWPLPIRHPEAFVEKLRAFDGKRAELAEMIRAAESIRVERSWSDVAAEFERFVKKD